VPDIGEEVAYYRGELKLFKKDYDSCATIMRKLMVDFPQGFYVNDALQLIMVFDEAKDIPDLMEAYGRALMYRERLLPDSSRLWLERLTLNENKTLADDALYQLTTLNLSQQDTVSALGSIERLATEYPDSYYSPYGLKMKADILLQGKGTHDEAKLLYRQLLEKYPNYPFASEVRKKLRQLETDSKIG
jgi:tetratricopeptide (TPR) repeat protein